MGLTWRTRGDGTADAVEWDPFAEVVYEDNEVLILNVARGITVDRLLENALVDTLARHDRRETAQTEIATIAESFGLLAHPDGTGGEVALTIAPPWTARADI